MPNKLSYKTEWDFNAMFKSDSDPAITEERKNIESAANKFESKWKKRTDYLTKASALKEALDDYKEFQTYYAEGGKEWFYFYLRHEQNQNNPEIRAQFNKAEDFRNKIDDKVRFFSLTLSKVDEKTQNLFLKSKELANYKHYLEVVFKNARYLLSEPEEKIMALKSNPAYSNWVKMTSGFLSREEAEVFTGKKKELKNFSDILGLIEHSNKKVRDSAASAFNSILEKYIDVATEELNSIVGNKKIDDELRGLKRPDEGRHLSDDIESEIVDTVIKTVSQHNDTSERYYKLKAKILGVKKLDYWERNIPIEGKEQEYLFDDSVKLISKVFQDLHPKFNEIFLQLLSNGQVDVFPKKGKRSGAFCAYHLISNPTYVLLNHTNKLGDVTTIAHEFGHAINDELIKTKQHALHFGTSLATAEVASTFMEDFVLDEIIKTADDETKLSIIMKKLDSDVSSIFRQVACYQFEQSIHESFREKGYLSKEDIGALFKKYMSGYMGDAINQNAGSQNWWVYWIHIRYFFYVYSYASGLLISKGLQHSVKKDHKFIEKVITFLSSGTSDTPRNIFLKTGIDIGKKKFWEDGIAEINALIDQAEKLAKKLHKI